MTSLRLWPPVVAVADVPLAQEQAWSKPVDESWPHLWSLDAAELAPQLLHQHPLAPAAVVAVAAFAQAPLPVAVVVSALAPLSAAVVARALALVAAVAGALALPASQSWWLSVGEPFALATWLVAASVVVAVGPWPLALPSRLLPCEPVAQVKPGLSLRPAVRHPWPVLAPVAAAVALLALVVVAAARPQVPAAVAAAPVPEIDP